MPLIELRSHAAERPALHHPAGMTANSAAAIPSAPAVERTAIAILGDSVNRLPQNPDPRQLADSMLYQIERSLPQHLAGNDRFRLSHDTRDALHSQILLTVGEARAAAAAEVRHAATLAAAKPDIESPLPVTARFSPPLDPKIGQLVHLATLLEVTADHLKTPVEV